MVVMTRIAIIDREVCIKEKCGYICMKVCPGVLMGDDTVTVDKDGFPVISEVLCTGCGICPKKCPVDCITIINLAEEAGTPVFQYGVNEFRQYGMPLAQKGVTGFVGKNGIGKTTSLRMLSGGLVPNFGEYGKKWELGDAASKFKNEQAQYFRQLGKNELKVALKPQNVDKIPAHFKGRVRDLIAKADERKKMDDAVRLFDLEAALGKDIAEISGGELQRAAIAATWCRDADIYYFDEPASYLDIEQRMKVAVALKELSEEKKVIVVEHDLALFDYLSEYVYIFYGQENAYGIVSGLKNTRSGINEYLDGFLREENVRFRDYPIKFQEAAATESKADVKFHYPPLSKSFLHFKFEAEGGKIHRGEVVGIVGPNATGKTLFVKMLAGAEKSDSDEVGIGKLRVSYKPQYVKAVEGITVRELYSGQKLNAMVLEEAHRKLNVASLMDKPLEHLSGGELQRVAIVLALSQDADIYLLDEPSAYLDVEQRLHLAGLVHRLIENSDKAAFVVDHDLLLVDAIASRLMVFEGESGKIGHASAPENKRDGLNKFLKKMGITLRRDPDSGRPRINKPGSALDREQKEAGEYYHYKRE